jgi:hypothetical protein
LRLSDPSAKRDRTRLGKLFPEGGKPQGKSQAEKCRAEKYGPNRLAIPIFLPDIFLLFLVIKPAFVFAESPTDISVPHFSVSAAYRKMRDRKTGRDGQAENF